MPTFECRGSASPELLPATVFLLAAPSSPHAA